MSFVEPRGGPAEVVATLRRWLELPDGPSLPRLVVETSGSSGVPKRVVLSRRAVLASVAATERRLGAGGRWVLALPPAYVAGVQVVCRSLVAGPEPVVLDPGAPWPELDGPWFTSLVPTRLRRLLDDPVAVARLRTAHTVLLGGGPIDERLRARSAGAGLRVVATYGSAETAGGCVYDGVPLDGVAVAVGRGGRVRVHGPMLFEGYDGDPSLTAEALVDGWFLTSDAGRVGDDGRLEVLGRLDDMVVSGGVNVPAAAVAARLREHPDVAAAEVLGVPDDEWGRRVVAFLVGRLSVEEARAWVAAAHPRSWAPREVVALDRMPLLPNGKPDRVALRAIAAGDAA